jgi:hypothetical protein
MLNVPDVNLSYIAIIYAFAGSPAGSTLNFGIVDMSNNVVQQTSLPSTSSTDINNPSVIQYNFSPVISTVNPRCLRIAIYNGSFSGSAYVNVRTVILGFN